MRVLERMTPNPTVIQCDNSLTAAKALMEAESIRHVPVIEDGKLVGILSGRDVHRYWNCLDSTRVSAAMTPAPVTIGPEAAIETAATLLIRHRVRALPVMADERLVGIITTTDLLKALLDIIEKRRLRITR